MNYKYTLTTGGIRSETFFNVYSVYTYYDLSLNSNLTGLPISY